MTWLVGGSERVLSEVRLGDHIAWMKTGRLIYTVHEAEPNQGDINLWGIQLKADTGLPSGPPVRITNDRDAIAGLSADADGKRLALLSQEFSGRCVRCRAGGAG